MAIRPKPNIAVRAIQNAMAKYPQLRVGQVLAGALNTHVDIYYMPDEELAKRIVAYLENRP